MENNRLDIIGSNACGIYGFLFPDNKWLVGYSSQMTTRLGRYFAGERLNSKFKDGLKKYGWEAVKLYVLEECENNKSVLLAREAYWSKKLNSVNDGYNVALCGSDGKNNGKYGILGANGGHLQNTVYDETFKRKVSEGMKRYHARKNLGTPPSI